MEVVDPKLGLRMTVENNQKNPSIFALSTDLRLRLSLDERTLGLCPNWLIDAFYHRYFDLPKVLVGLIALEGGVA
jgi:hypothetical protein